ncbi:MAG: hypothetical protein ABIR96_01030, partial [Bdellovibrionota bacterium]
LLLGLTGTSTGPTSLIYRSVDGGDTWYLVQSRLASDFFKEALAVSLLEHWTDQNSIVHVSRPVGFVLLDSMHILTPDGGEGL